MATARSTDGRTVGYADFGQPGHTPVIWCHGGPGSRMEPQGCAQAAGEAGIRLIGIDRPGYGASTPLPGRHIGDWPADAVAVADALGIQDFFVVGVSTGGAYALACAAGFPLRVRGVLNCCAMTDMSWAVDHAMMSPNVRIWQASGRDEAIFVAEEDFGADGSRMLEGDDVAAMLAPADLAYLADPELAANFASPEPFAQGAQGYADDRIADAPRNGWSSFQVEHVVCPVVVIHGESDLIVPVAHAHHTADIVADAKLMTFPDHGHLSINAEIVAALEALIAQS